MLEIRDVFLTFFTYLLANSGMQLFKEQNLSSPFSVYCQISETLLIDLLFDASITSA